MVDVSGNPDETLRQIAREADEFLTEFADYLDCSAIERIRDAALAGVGEHRPDQPQTTLDSAPAKERQDARAYPASDVRGNALNHAGLCAWRFGGTCDCAAPKERDRG